MAAVAQVRTLIELLRAEVGPTPDAKEGELLEWFVETFASRRAFANSAEGDPDAADFARLFDGILRARFVLPAWWDVTPEVQRLRVLQAVRLLLREPSLQSAWAELPGVTSVFAERFARYADTHCSATESAYGLEIVVEFAAMAKRLCAHTGAGPRQALAQGGVPRTLVLLLSSGDAVVLHSVVVALVHLAMDSAQRASLSGLDCVPSLLRHLRDGGQEPLRQAVAQLLLLLAREPRARADIRSSNGTAALLRYGRLQTRACF